MFNSISTHLICILMLVANPLQAADTPQNQGIPSEALEVSQRPRVLLVQPIILCDDDGSLPAHMALPKRLIDQVYTRAGLEFLYLEPKHWHHGKARRGDITLNEIVKLGKSNGIIPADPRVVSLIFVSGVDGNTGPLGRGLQGGNICFVSLGVEKPMTDPAAQAFVIAHEVGHNLGLIHAADDPLVPDDIPNLQGEGPFEDRMAVGGLHPTQVTTILKSPLVTERIKFLSREESAAALTDETWFPFMKNATPDILRFALGLPPDTPIPTDPTERMEFARNQHAAMAEEFTADERIKITETVNRLREHIKEDWPMMCRLPWHFAKTKAGFCRNFPHTRSLVTVLSADAAQALVLSPQRSFDLLFHEKIHVLQRLNPGRFHSLYRQYGYTPITLQERESDRLNLIQNPDAPINDWAASLPSGPVLIATHFKPEGDKLGFTEVYRHLTATANGTFTVADPIKDTVEIDQWRARFPIRLGYDHPHEVFAYLCGSILHERLQHSAISSPNKITEATQQSLKSIFRIDGQ